MKKPILFLVFLGLAWAVQAQDCCSDSSCRAKAESIAMKVNEYTAVLGTSTGDEDEDDRTLIQLKLKNTHLFRKLRNSIEAFDVFRDETTFTDPDDCVFQQINEHSVKWVMAWHKFEDKSSKLGESTQFRAGTHRQYELGWGPAGIGSSNESGTVNLRVMFTETLPRSSGDRPNVGGRWRLLGGIDWLYERRVSSLAGVGRIEFRIDDIKTDFGGLGAYKIFPEVRVSDKYQWLGFGAGIEVYRWGFWACFNQRLQDGYQSIRAGFMCRISMSTKKDKEP